MASRATLIADALRPKKAPDAPDVFSAPKQSWADYVGAPPATGYEGMPAPQAEGMPTHDPDGTVSRIANALATLPTVQSIKEQVMLPRQILSGEKGVPQSFGPTTPDAQTDEAIGFGIGNAVRPGAAMSIAKMPLAPGEAVLGSGPIRAYHGSPHDFDKFDLSKIGTGEGAQAYGHGLYFAEKEGVARSYRDALSPVKFKALTPAEDDAIGLILPALKNAKPEEAAALLDKHIANSERFVAVQPGSGEEVVLSALQKLKANGEFQPKSDGRMYEVAIHADPERFLDWDKPLAGQHPELRDKLVSTFGDATTMLPTTVTQGKNGRWYTMNDEGRVVGRFEGWPEKTAANEALKIIRDQAIPNYTVGEWHNKMNSPIAATEKLREAGIPGIKYLDQGSRAAGDGSRNYVLFDDKIVEILRKYGVGSIAALPPAVQMAIQLHQDQTQAEPQEPTFAGKASKMINDLQRKLRGSEPPATPLGMGIRG